MFLRNPHRTKWSNHDPAILLIPLVMAKQAATLRNYRVIWIIFVQGLVGIGYSIAINGGISSILVILRTK